MPSTFRKPPKPRPRREPARRLRVSAERQRSKKFCQFRSRVSFIGVEPEAPTINTSAERNNMQLTRHARIRMQQRGITETILDLLYAYGRFVERGKAGAIVHFDKRAREFVKKTLSRRDYARIEPKLNAYIVEARDGSILTVGYRYKPIHA